MKKNPRILSENLRSASKFHLIILFVEVIADALQNNNFTQVKLKMENIASIQKMKMRHDDLNNC